MVCWENKHFSDVQTGQRFSMALSQVGVSKEDREWRGAYYGSDKWRRAFPEAKQRSTMVNWLEVLEPYSRLDPARESKATAFEKRAARYLATLTADKARKSRQRRRVQAQRQGTDASDSSSSSSSSSDSSQTE